MSGEDRLLAEIREQPAAWRAMAAADVAADLGGRLARRPPSLVRLAAHGTSQHAADYGAFVLRLLTGVTAVVDSMSIALAYGAPAAAPGELAVGISQSGETPDVVAWLRAAREAGAHAVAVTNAAGSALAAAADDVLLLDVGDERSVAATKTYTGTVALLASLAAHAAGHGPAMREALARTADVAAAALPGLEEAAADVAAAHAGADRLFVVARGLELPTAAELALKATEVAYVTARSLTATSLAHGPVAALDREVPLWAIAERATLPAMLEAVRRAQEAGSPVVVSGAAAADVPAGTRVVTPPGADPLLTPLLSILPGQLYARSLALAKGLDPQAPRHLAKVTAAA